MKLASHIRPFDAKQKIYVLNDKYDTEEMVLCNLQDFAETVLQLLGQYSISLVELHGPEEICLKTKRDIVKCETEKYSTSRLNVVIKKD